MTTNTCLHARDAANNFMLHNPGPPGAGPSQKPANDGTPASMTTIGTSESRLETPGYDQSNGFTNEVWRTAWYFIK